MKAIKWSNKFSGESGYVESLADRHFINTWQLEYASKYRSQAEAEKALDKLYDFGEDANNDFEIVDIPKPEKSEPEEKKSVAKPSNKNKTKKTVSKKK